MTYVVANDELRHKHGPTIPKKFLDRRRNSYAVRWSVLIVGGIVTMFFTAFLALVGGAWGASHQVTRNRESIDSLQAEYKEFRNKDFPEYKLHVDEQLKEKVDKSTYTTNREDLLLQLGEVCKRLGAIEATQKDLMRILLDMESRRNAERNKPVGNNPAISSTTETVSSKTTNQTEP